MTQKTNEDNEECTKGGEDGIENGNKPENRGSTI
jgi:hypothetical protein